MIVSFFNSGHNTSIINLECLQDTANKVNFQEIMIWNKTWKKCSVIFFSLATLYADQAFKVLLSATNQ